MNEKFIKGLFLKKREGSPDFVKGTLSFKTEEFIEAIVEYTNSKGYANVDILQKDNGELYLKPNLYGLTTNDKEECEVPEIDSIPF
jgi:hypothetical protein